MTSRARPPRLRDRPTTDLVMLALTGLVCLILLAAVVAVLISEVLNPTADTSDIWRRLAAMVSSIIAAIVGYAAGRGESR